jgi:hypothetical protein
MSKVRCQVITRREGMLAIDHIVNVVYFDDFNIDPTGGTDWQAFATDVRNAFNQRPNIPSGYGCEVKVYNMGDAEPRPIKATSPWAASQFESGPSAPREVALCLSYFSERNLPRFRGRIYIGPWNTAAERPSTAQVQFMTQLAVRLANIGGIDVDWQLHSPTRAAFSKVTNAWADNEWDTVRSRGFRATERIMLPTGE